MYSQSSCRVEKTLFLFLSNKKVELLYKSPNVILLQMCYEYTIAPIVNDWREAFPSPSFSTVSQPSQGKFLESQMHRSISPRSIDSLLEGLFKKCESCLERGEKAPISWISLSQCRELLEDETIVFPEVWHIIW